jgi:hypothetical protein
MDEGHIDVVVIFSGLPRVEQNIGDVSFREILYVNI